MDKSQKPSVLELVKQAGMLRPRDLDQYGIPREYLSRLRNRGMLRQVGRGLYTLPDAEWTAHHSLAEASKRVPRGVICLLSALQFHELTTQLPFQVWMAIPNNARKPKVDGLQIRFARFSGPAFDEGIETHTIEHIQVRIYNPAKTVADCFKYRNKIGLDVAIESLRDCIRERKATMDDLYHFAQICRMTNVMRPYMEAVV